MTTFKAFATNAYAGAIVCALSRHLREAPCIMSTQSKISLVVLILSAFSALLKPVDSHAETLGGLCRSQNPRSVDNGSETESVELVVRNQEFQKAKEYLLRESQKTEATVKDVDVLLGDLFTWEGNHEQASIYYGKYIKNLESQNLILGVDKIARIAHNSVIVKNYDLAIDLINCKIKYPENTQPRDHLMAAYIFDHAGYVRAALLSAENYIKRNPNDRSIRLSMLRAADEMRDCYLLRKYLQDARENDQLDSHMGRYLNEMPPCSRGVQPPRLFASRSRLPTRAFLKAENYDEGSGARRNGDSKTDAVSPSLRIGQPINRLAFFRKLNVYCFDTTDDGRTINVRTSLGGDASLDWDTINMALRRLVWRPTSDGRARCRRAVIREDGGPPSHEAFDLFGAADIR